MLQSKEGDIYFSPEVKEVRKKQMVGTNFVTGMKDA